MHSAPTQPGLIIVDSSLGVVAYNGEALHILSYPDQPGSLRHPETWLGNKVRSDLVGKQSPPRFVEGFRSARRMYLCRSFPLDVNKSSNPSSGGLLMVMLERRSNGTVKIAEISARFGLTAREQETVQFLLQGLTSKEIAQRMKISPNTVKAFIRLVMVKMDVSTRSGIIGRFVGSKL